MRTNKLAEQIQAVDPDGWNLLNERAKLLIETAKTTLCDMLSGLEEVPEDDLAALVGNIKSMVEPWRRSIGSDGELRFYIDNF